MISEIPTLWLLLAESADAAAGLLGEGTWASSSSGAAAADVDAAVAAADFFLLFLLCWCHFGSLVSWRLSPLRKQP